MKRCVVLLAVLMLSLTLIPNVTATLQPVHKLWALIVCGTFPEFAYDSWELRSVLQDHYSFDGIKFIEAPLSKQEVRDAITDWLGSRSDGDDQIFIFIISHGGGLHKYNDTAYILAGGRWELNSDEGNEVSETQAALGYDDLHYGWVITQMGVDFNDNGVLESDVYAGVDECIYIDIVHDQMEPDEFRYVKYWDDEVREDLATLNYRKLVFCYQGCKVVNQTLSCYSGGLIDDLSASNRTIITSSNETSVSYGYPDFINPVTFDVYYIGYFSRAFIDALNPDEGFELADTNNDEIVSIWEAWKYAYNNDPVVEGFWEEGEWYQETPQLEDNGDGAVDYESRRDGLFSMETCFVSEVNLKTPDIKEDGCVDVYDAIIMAGEFGEDGESRCDLNNDLVVDIYDFIILAESFGRCY
jgi:hypothetical protein